MTERCDKCGTELEAEQYRHHRFRFEPVSDADDLLDGRLCADCVVDFKRWLEGKDDQP